ncbi:MAG: VacB/RNase II family 3'-5' exoribonuclease [Fibromonadaceae bacterium]|jgi:ribonuclease R|nr:VacB/RNase II family 3'-5' exoribonuclease [Fibromonadaceae bacterium]
MKKLTQFDSLKKQFMETTELDKKFSKEIISETQKFAKDSFAKDKKREDFRHLHIVCIDPDGARDHDDAISVEEIKDGYILGVHIADVSHFVRPGSELDKEALKRSYTQYLPWAAVPMLPEILSADLCSLKENEDRFSFSCIMTLDKKFKVRKYRFAKGLIKVSCSITYGQATELFEKKDKSICLLARIAAGLKKGRNESGILELDSTEYQCEFNKKGEPLRIVPRVSDKSNSWIEECMLAANRCCALELQKRKLNGIYRVHKAPDPQDVMELMNTEPNLFSDSTINPNKVLKSYNAENSQDNRIFQLYLHLVKKAKGNPVLTNKILRSMQKAQYSEECNGHFALHWKDYTHFTSPIRRYADLWCHRELNKKKAGKWQVASDELCSSLNETEIINQKIERKALKLCVSYLLQDRIGETFSAEIQGVEEFGIFISVTDEIVAMADGLVHIRDIPGDFYVHDETRGILVGKRTGRRFKRGDKITVKLTRVNPIKGENDFEMIEQRTQRTQHTDKKSPWKKSECKKNERKFEKKERRFGRR